MCIVVNIHSVVRRHRHRHPPSPSPSPSPFPPPAHVPLRPLALTRDAEVPVTAINFRAHSRPSDEKWCYEQRKIAGCAVWDALMKSTRSSYTCNTSLRHDGRSHDGYCFHCTLHLRTPDANPAQLLITTPTYPHALSAILLSSTCHPL